jgi:hypothetical protein
MCILTNVSHVPIDVNKIMAGNINIKNTIAKKDNPNPSL